MEATDQQSSIPSGFSLRFHLHEKPITKYYEKEDVSKIIFRLRWSCDGKYLAAPSQEDVIRIWDIDAGKILRKISMEGGGFVICADWSHDNKRIALGASDHKIRIYDIFQGKFTKTLLGHDDWVHSVAWSPDNFLIASASFDQILRIWEPDSKKDESIEIKASSGRIVSLSWSPDSKMLAIGTDTGTIQIWDRRTWKCIETIQHHYVLDDGSVVPAESEFDLTLLLSLKKRKNLKSFLGRIDSVLALTWSPDGKNLTSGSSDRKIKIWDSSDWQQKAIVEGHSDMVTSVSYLSNGKYLVSKSMDNTVRLWDCTKWLAVAELNEISAGNWLTAIACHPFKPIISTLGNNDTTIRVWDIDEKAFARSIVETQKYKYSKIVFVGDRGVGKTSLVNAILGKKYAPTDSTFGVKVEEFEFEDADKLDPGIQHGALIWDLAGQHDFRIVNRLFLEDITAGIVVIDASDRQDPDLTVKYWSKALDKCSSENCIKLLVAGRTDVSSLYFLNEDIDNLINQYSFDKFIETSSKDAEGMEELKNTLNSLIPWDCLPVTSSPELWIMLRKFIMNKRQKNVVLMKITELYTEYINSTNCHTISRDEFDAVIRDMEKQGLLMIFRSDDRVLLNVQELIFLASSIIFKARRQEVGLGCTKIKDIYDSIKFSKGINQLYPDDKKALFSTLIKILVEKEIAFIQGEYLVFPSLFNRKCSSAALPAKPEFIIHFEGILDEIYANMIVKLYYTDKFDIYDMWKNKVEFRDSSDRAFGIEFNAFTPENGIFYLFFNKDVTVNTKALFTKYVEEQLHKHQSAISNSIKRERIYYCPVCGIQVESKYAVQTHRQSINCEKCKQTITLVDELEAEIKKAEIINSVSNIDRMSKDNIKQSASLIKRDAQSNINRSDVFFSFNSNDKDDIEIITHKLREIGINPWLYSECKNHGRPFIDSIAEALYNIDIAVIFFGRTGISGWQKIEIENCIKKYADSNGKMKIIPVLLPGVYGIPKETLISYFAYIRFMQDIHEEAPIKDLAWDIKGISLKKGIRSIMNL